MSELLDSLIELRRKEALTYEVYLKEIKALSVNIKKPADASVPRQKPAGIRLVATAKSSITVSGISVQVVRKDIKNLHLPVYPPDGHVRVAVPKQVSDDNVRLAVVQKLSWIRKKQQDFQDQPRQSEREYISGECHYFFGKRCRLELIERDGTPEIELLKSGKRRSPLSALNTFWCMS